MSGTDSLRGVRVGKRGFQRLFDFLHNGLTDRVALLGGEGAARPRERGDDPVALVAQRAESLCLQVKVSFTHCGAELDQLVELGAAVSGELVDHPGGGRGLAQRCDLRTQFPVPAGSVGLRAFVARGGELLRRQAVELVSDLSHVHVSPHTRQPVTTARAGLPSPPGAGRE